MWYSKASLRPSTVKSSRGKKDDMPTITSRGFAGILIVYFAIVVSAGLTLIVPATLGLDYRSLGINRDQFLIGQYLLAVVAAIAMTSAGLVTWKRNLQDPLPPSVGKSGSAARIYAPIALGLGILTIIADLVYLLFFLIISGLARLDYSTPVSFLPGMLFFLATKLLPVVHAIVAFVVLRQQWKHLAQK